MSAIDQSAQRTCTQCKSSKKRCDKLLPSCSRCSRLSINCVYSEHEKLNHLDLSRDAAGSFNEVFQRLEKLEAHVFPSRATTSPMAMVETTHENVLNTNHTIRFNSANWELNPGILQPQYMGWIMRGSILRALRESNTTIEVIGQEYFSRYHTWIPMVSQTKFEKERVDFNDLKPSDNYGILILAIHLLVTPMDRLPSTDSILTSPWYRACKYHFGQEVTLKEPYIELIQAGMLIALFEHLQCVGNRALTTLGISARLAYALELDERFAQLSDPGSEGMTREDEEILLTWWCLTLLDRYLSMPPAVMPRYPSVPVRDPQGGPPVAAFTTLTQDALRNLLTSLIAANHLGKVQALLCDNGKTRAQAFAEEARLVSEGIDHQLRMFRVRTRTRNAASWAGEAVTLVAALQLQCFYAERLDSLSQDTAIAIHSFIEQLRAAASQYREAKGFIEDYLEVSAPAWISTAFEALAAYKTIQSTDPGHQFPEIDMGLFIEALHITREQYRLADHCYKLLDAAVA